MKTAKRSPILDGIAYFGLGVLLTLIANAISLLLILDPTGNAPNVSRFGLATMVWGVGLLGSITLGITAYRKTKRQQEHYEKRSPLLDGIAYFALGIVLTVVAIVVVVLVFGRGPHVSVINGVGIIGSFALGVYGFRQAQNDQKG